MSTKFKQTDIVRAVKAAKAAGLDVGSFEIFPDSRIIVRMRSEADHQDDGATALAKWEKSRHAS